MNGPINSSQIHQTDAEKMKMKTFNTQPVALVLFIQILLPGKKEHLRARREIPDFQRSVGPFLSIARPQRRCPSVISRLSELENLKSSVWCGQNGDKVRRPEFIHY